MKKCGSKGLQRRLERSGERRRRAGETGNGARLVRIAVNRAVRERLLRLLNRHLQTRPGGTEGSTPIQAVLVFQGAVTRFVSPPTLVTSYREIIFESICTDATVIPSRLRPGETHGNMGAAGERRRSSRSQEGSTN